MVANSLDVIAQGGYFLGRHEENDVFRLQEAIRIIEAIASKFDSNVLLMKIYLEKRLRKLGRDAEAAEVQAEMNEALGPDDIELESN